MTGRAKVESLSVARNSFLQILRLSQLLEESGNGAGKAIERRGAIWMTEGAKGESMSVVCDGLACV
jgi:hypothetical protein